jgi:hypothetical protein
MQYDDDSLIEEQSFKLSDNTGDENLDDADELDVPEELNDFGSDEEETDTGY